MEVSFVKPKSRQGFVSLLSSAACEWLLIFLLLVDAAFSYLLTKFALYCKLQIPCPLCSRIDHVFEKNEPAYIRSLFCCNHKDDISSLVCCHNHGKLADIHAMCEDCIMSFARSRKPTSELYRLLVCRLGVDIEDSGLKIQLFSRGFLPDSSGPKTCSCCNRMLRAKTNTQRLLQVNPVGCGASKANAKPPLPRLPGRSRFSRRESLKKFRDKFGGSMSPRSAARTKVDSLSHVGYTELKITSDSESEFPFSDEDDVTFAIHGKNDYDMEQSSQKLSRNDNDESSKQAHLNSEPVPSLLDQPVQLDSVEQNSMTSRAPGGFLQHGLEGINWSCPHLKPSPSALPELISLDDVPQPVENPKSSASVATPSNLAILSELISLNNVLSPPNVVEVSDESPDVTATSDTENVSVAKHKTIPRVLNDRSPSMPNSLNSDDPLSLSHSEERISGIPTETCTTSISAKPEENLKLLSRLSSPGVDPSSNIATPGAHDHHNGSQKSDNPTCSDGIDMVQMAAALERHDSAHESIDGINVKEIEGETVLDRLRRQVEYDKRCMRALFKELEEERSAAAVAANQAMAMITRLQEEKASLHMEALQYLRMMEEQAEYDMEALEKANDLLAEKEKEMQDLEAEFEVYRNKFLENTVVDDPQKGTGYTKGDKKTALIYQAAHIESCPSATDLSKLTNTSESIYVPKQGSSPTSNFEDEKLYISECLKKLESKLHELSGSGAVTNLSNGGYSAKVTSDDNQEEVLADNGTQTCHTKGENGLSTHRDSISSNGSLEKEKPAESVEKNNLVRGQSYCPAVDHRKLSSHEGELVLDTFRSEITDLKGRLEALEADGDILNHALNTLRNGNDGLQFIQEIARQLQELRKIEFKRRCLCIP